MNENEKPTIIVSVHKTVDEEVLKDILFGIEEEGIPYSIIKNEDVPAVSAGYSASLQSKLSVGIGCSNEEVVVHHKNLRPEKYLFKITDYRSKPKELKRTLGSNAARLVKGNIFKDNEDLEVSF